MAQKIPYPRRLALFRLGRRRYFQFHIPFTYTDAQPQKLLVLFCNLNKAFINTNHLLNKK
jgi:hypothetical protein